MLKKRFGGLLAALMLFGCSGNPLPVNLEAGDALPQFSVRMNNGTRVRTADLLGQPSVIVFFSVDCIDCRHLLPQIQKLWDMDLGLPIVLIARKNTTADIVPFWAFSEFTMTYSPQRSRRIYSRFAPSRIPRIYISDDQGIIRYIHADEHLPSAWELADEIESLTQNYTSHD